MSDVALDMFEAFLSHLSGDEELNDKSSNMYDFLSHLSGDEALHYNRVAVRVFLSHLSGDEDFCI